MYWIVPYRIQGCFLIIMLLLTYNFTLSSGDSTVFNQLRITISFAFHTSSTESISKYLFALFNVVNQGSAVRDFAQESAASGVVVLCVDVAPRPFSFGTLHSLCACWPR